MTGTAKLHATELTPTKLELLRQWLPTQEWFDADPSMLIIVGSYRLVDPDDLVGIEGLLLSSDHTTWHIPLTYRPAPLRGQDEVGTLHHGVLGQRWVYYGPTDAVYVEVTNTAIRRAQTQAALSDGRPDTARAIGSGQVPDVPTNLVVAHRADYPVQGLGTLDVSWGASFEHNAPLAALIREDDSACSSLRSR